MERTEIRQVTADNSAVITAIESGKKRWREYGTVTYSKVCREEEGIYYNQAIPDRKHADMGGWHEDK